MWHPRISPTIFGILIVGLFSFAAQSAAEPPPRPCDEIIPAGLLLTSSKATTKRAMDCCSIALIYIMRGTKQPAIADKPLPEISPELIEGSPPKGTRNSDNAEVRCHKGDFFVGGIVVHQPREVAN